MANITQSSLASAVAAEIRNQQFVPVSEVIPSKILIIGSGNPATEAGNQLNTPIQVFSAEDVGNRTGFGYMLNRLAKYAFSGGQGIETWMIQQAEDGAAVKATGEIDFTGSTGVQAGTLYIYISGEQYQVSITTGMTIENITDACVAKINSVTDSPVVASKVAVTFELTLTAKQGGTYGNDITIALNRNAGEETPTGITAAITAMSSGTTIPDITLALNSLGTGDGANENHFTKIVHGYLQDTTTLDAISAYVGEGNEPIGCWDEVVHRPFVSYTGETAAGTAGLTAIRAVGDARKNDRANEIISVPGSYSHPSEIAALACGITARFANELPDKDFQGQLMSGIDPGDKADRWTSEHDNRDLAVKSGIGTTVVKSEAVFLSDVITTYHPDSVAQTSNGYRKDRNISIASNIVNNVASLFESESFQGKTIVTDTARVSDPVAKLNVVDVDTVKDALVALIRDFERKAWIYDGDFTIDELKKEDSVTVRTGGNGFNVQLKYIPSGTTDIIDTTILFDTSIAILL